MHKKFSLFASLIMLATLIAPASAVAQQEPPTPTVPPELQLPENPEDVIAAVVSYCEWFGWQIVGVEDIGTTPEVVLLVGTGPYPNFHDFYDAYDSEYSVLYVQGESTYVRIWDESYVNPNDRPKPGGNWWVGIAYYGLEIQSQDPVFGQTYTTHQCYWNLLPIIIRIRD